MRVDSVIPARGVEGGSFDVRWREPATVHTVYSGRLTSALLRAGTDAAFELARGRDWRFGLLDCGGITGFDPDVRHAATELIDTFRSRGGREGVLIVRSNALRMIATALAFGTGLPIRAFSDRAAAETYLRDRGGLP